MVRLFFYLSAASTFATLAATHPTPAVAAAAAVAAPAAAAAGAYGPFIPETAMLKGPDISLYYPNEKDKEVDFDVIKRELEAARAAAVDAGAGAGIESNSADGYWGAKMSVFDSISEAVKKRLGKEISRD